MPKWNLFHRWYDRRHRVLPSSRSGSCFETLHLNVALRGGIGVIEASRTLWVEAESFSE
ncbi:MAG: hypothetical protein JEZ11_21540 [Desulfobacterales bacterium]|nr:hypothetical protein [Desulfobacterales bacterium]